MHALGQGIELCADLFACHPLCRHGLRGLSLACALFRIACLAPVRAIAVFLRRMPKLGRWCGSLMSGQVSAGVDCVCKVVQPFAGLAILLCAQDVADSLLIRHAARRLLRFGEVCRQRLIPRPGLAGERLDLLAKRMILGIKAFNLICRLALPGL